MNAMIVNKDKNLLQSGILHGGYLTVAVSLAFAVLLNLCADCPLSIICKDAGHFPKVFCCLQVMPASVRMVRQACPRLNARARVKGLMLQRYQVKVQEPVSHVLPLLLTWMIWQT